MPNQQIINGEPYRYAYQGQEKDSETNKEAFQLRLWDARIGRWLTTDPARQYASPYMGMGNNPISRYDPDGGCDQPDSSCGWFKRFFYSSNSIERWEAWQEMGTTGSSVILDEVQILTRAQKKAILIEYYETENFAQSLRDMGMDVTVTDNRREAINSNINFMVGLALPSGKLAPKGTSLSEDVGKTFFAGRYEKIVLQESMTLSRYYDNVSAFAKGRYMTNSTSLTGINFIDRMGLALRSEWNSMTKVAHWNLPAGTTVFKGRAGMQFPWFGGGTQYFVPNIHNIQRVIKP